MKTVLIAGASGLIGKSLVSLLSTQYSINILSRNKSNFKSPNIFYWNPENHEIDSNAFTDVFCVINLSGENIAAKRWSKQQKEKIITSRTLSTQTLIEGIEKFGSSVTTYISSSAVGYYGSSKSNEIYNEDNVCGNDFLAKTCVEWESEVMRIKNKNIRKVIIRTGVVLSNKGGVFQKTIQTIPFHFLPIFGSGNQIFPWIHIDDICAIYEFAISNQQISGAYNAVSPNSISNKEFIFSIQSKINKKVFVMKIPTLLLQLVFGEMSILLTSGNTISTNKLIESGYKYKFSSINKAIEDLIHIKNEK